MYLNSLLVVYTNFLGKNARQNWISSSKKLLIHNVVHISHYITITLYINLVQECKASFWPDLIMGLKKCCGFLSMNVISQSSFLASFHLRIVTTRKVGSLQLDTISLSNSFDCFCTLRRDERKAYLLTSIDHSHCIFLYCI